MTVIPQTFHEVYEVTKKLGEGSFGEVFQCKRKDNNEEFAVKSIIPGKMLVYLIQNEVDICLQLKHRNVIKLFEYYIEEAECLHHLVFELASGGELYDDILAKDRYSEVEASHCLEQILQGLAYIHKKRIVHRDLKPDNILLNETEDCTVVKIADFGTAMQLREGEGFEFVGKLENTGYWMAPEMPLGQFCSLSVDLWACGTMLHIMIYGTPPFNGEGETLLDEMLKAEFLFSEDNRNDGVSDDVKDLIDQLLIADAKTRLSAEVALTNQFIVKHRNVSSRFHRPQAIEKPAESGTIEDRAGVSEVKTIDKVSDEANMTNEQTSSLAVLKEQQGSARNEANPLENSSASIVNRTIRDLKSSESSRSFKQTPPSVQSTSVHNQDKTLKTRKRATSLISKFDVTDDVVPLKRSAPVIGFLNKSKSTGNEAAIHYESKLVKTSTASEQNGGQLKKKHPKNIKPFDVTKPHEVVAPKAESLM